MQPEALWARLGVPARCSDVIWWRDPRCVDKSNPTRGDLKGDVVSLSGP